MRDPLNLCFGLGFPLVLILLLSAIQANIPVSLFEIQHLTPGVTVFGLSFMTLFSAVIISKDRGSAFLQRLYTTPLTPLDFILGYTLPMLPIALGQSVICYIAALILGLDFSVNILYALLFILPVSLFFIALGLLFGSILNDKAVGGVCGALSPLGEANVIVTTYLADTYYTPKTFWEEKCQKDYAAVLSEFTVLESTCKETTMGGMNAYQVVFTHKMGNDTYKQLQVIAVASNMVYTLQYTAKLADYDTNIEDVESIRANFALR